MKEKAIQFAAGVVSLCLIGYALWTSPQWIGPKIHELCDIFWPMGLLVGPFCLLAAYASKSVGKTQDDLEGAYKWAMGGGLILLVSAILMLVMHYHY